MLIQKLQRKESLSPSEQSPLWRIFVLSHMEKMCQHEHQRDIGGGFRFPGHRSAFFFPKRWALRAFEKIQTAALCGMEREKIQA